ncbi:MAG TPA: FHA domain-containing protein [Longimicrobiaceae bacterium]|nr:FHA domain-containing protein [Longimicrobiaceae bacterium]
MKRFCTSGAHLPALALLPFVPSHPPRPAAALLAAGPDWTLWAGLLVAAVALAAVARSVVRALRTQADAEANSGPFIVFPTPAPGDGDDAPRPTFASQPLAASAAPFAPAAAPAMAHRTVSGTAPRVYEGHTIRFYIPTDGTLQLLPGRLEVVGGQDLGQEIRFVRTPEGPQEVTFGRSDGPPHRHVQLRAATVSRAHARMVFEDGAWTIFNLSRTNPVVLNGDELDGDGSEHALQDGDRIEMGEVVFTFRER